MKLNIRSSEYVSTHNLNNAKLFSSTSISKRDADLELQVRIWQKSFS